MLLLTALSIAGFVLVFLASDLVGKSKRVFEISNQAMAVMRDPALDDEAREKAVQKASIQLFGSFFGLAFRFAAAIAGAVLPLWLADLSGWISLAESMAFLSRIDVLIITTVMMLALWWVGRMLSRPDGDGYSAIDRLLHRVALSGSAVPKVLFDLERSRFLESSPEPAGLHIVVCGLARAGTTVIMRDIHATDMFGSLTYRDMPFAIAPNSFRSTTASASLETKERSHGDGVLVDLDSPEAIDEVFWRVHAGTDYIRSDRLVPHRPSDEHINLFRDYRRLILNKTGKSRYLSKANNTSLRLDRLAERLDDTIFVVPFRHPADQARSLQRQHERFSGSSKFQRDYVSWLGHFEFGDTHRPFAFAGMPEGGPDQLSYWLDIWRDVYAAMAEIAKDRGNILFVCYEDLCIDKAYQRALMQRLSLDGHELSELKTVERKHETPIAVPEDVVSLYETLRTLANAQLKQA